MPNSKVCVVCCGGTPAEPAATCTFCAFSAAMISCGVKAVSGHFIGVHPDAHTEIIGKPVDAAYAGHAQQRILYKNIGVVIKKGNVMRALGRIDGHHHQHAGVQRSNGNA